MDILNILALIMACVLSITFVYVVIYIHDIPYEIAKKRNHPHQDAIHIAGWVSLFLLHTIWPFLWIWAYLFKPGSPSIISVQGEGERIQKLEKEIAELRGEIKVLLGDKNTGKSGSEKEQSKEEN